MLNREGHILLYDCPSLFFVGLRKSMKPAVKVVAYEAGIKTTALASGQVMDAFMFLCI
jgi:hypothetical protein